MHPRQLFSATLTCAALSFILQTSAIAQTPESLPVCMNNGPYVAECNGQFATVPVTSTGSFDPDGTSITVFWFEECDYGFFDDPTNLTPNFVLDMGHLCTRSCVFALRVFSGGQQQNCVSNVTVQDTQPPILSLLSDLTDIWGIATDPGSTGIPTATDACDPAPVVQLQSDVHSGPLGPGQEDVIVRTFSATDNCGHVAQIVRRIILLSPLVSASNLELDVIGCNDVYDRASASPTVEFTLLGRTGTLVTGIQLNSLRLVRLGDLSLASVTPPNPGQFAPLDVGKFIATHIGDCNPPGTDGKKDLKLSFDRLTVNSVLGLDTLPAGTTVYFAITGRRNNNTPFIAGAKTTVQ
jgi:hypothetical protein